MQKKHGQKSLLLIFIIPAIIILFGIALGFYYSSLPGHHPQKNKQSCEGIGGEWSESQNKCLLANKKVGELCTDGAQCESGICYPPDLTEEQKTALTNNLIKNIVGTCHSDNYSTGCTKQVIMGTVSKKSMCLDD